MGIKRYISCLTISPCPSGDSTFVRPPPPRSLLCLLAALVLELFKSLKQAKVCQNGSGVGKTSTNVFRWCIPTPLVCPLDLPGGGGHSSPKSTGRLCRGRKNEAMSIYLSASKKGVYPAEDTRTHFQWECPPPRDPPPLRDRVIPICPLSLPIQQNLPLFLLFSYARTYMKFK